MCHTVIILPDLNYLKLSTLTRGPRLAAATAAFAKANLNTLPAPCRPQRVSVALFCFFNPGRRKKSRENLKKEGHTEDEFQEEAEDEFQEEEEEEEEEES